jgi:hypothetical protein
MLAGTPADLRTQATAIPEPFASAILRAIRPAPAERFASVKEFGAALGDARR